MINVLLVDDHELVRTAFELMLNGIEDIKVVGVAKSGEDAVDLASELEPDIILMDINMPGIGGLEACRRILHNGTKVKIIAVSVCNDGPVPHQLVKLGVLGFVSKGSPASEMIQAIRTVINGDRYMCADVANNLNYQGLSEDNSSPFALLSKRESTVVNLILQGKTIKEMSDTLTLSDKTINTYRHRLYSKLNVKNDIELIRLAIKFDNIDQALI